MLIKITTLCLLFSFSSMLIAFEGQATQMRMHKQKQHSHKTHKKPSKTNSLSPAVKKLLQKEMQAIEKSMAGIIPALASADWSRISRIGKAISNSFILKQELNDAQIEEIHQKLPKGFLQLDESFHYYAQMLSHAAENRKSELVSFYLAKMTETCSECHSRYAQHRFPGFISPKKEHHH